MLAAFDAYNDLHFVEHIPLVLYPVRPEPVPPGPLRSSETRRQYLHAVDGDVELMDLGREVLEPLIGTVLFRPRLDQVIAVGGKDVANREPAARAEGHVIAKPAGLAAISWLEKRLGRRQATR